MFWTTGGMVIQTQLEAVIASSLKLRGHNVHMVLCDGVYKACARRVDFPEVPVDDWWKYCKSCIRQNTQVLDKMGVEYSYISEIISPERSIELRKKANEVTFDNYKDLIHMGIPGGVHLESAILRHTRGGSYNGLEQILREYAFTVLVVTEASAVMLEKFNPTNVYMSHGIYADWGPALSMSLKKNIAVTSYICCYLTAHFFFGTVKKHDDVFLTISENSWKKYKDTELSHLQKEKLNSFLNKRYHTNSASDLKGILKDYKGNTEFFYKKYDLDPDKPIWGIMTHINWDAASDYFPMIHKNFDEWLFETVKKIQNIRDVQWLIKIHPSELNDNPETGCQKFIENNFPELASHIKIIKMDDDISPKDFYSIIDGGVTVMGTGGLELSLSGKPVILAGKAHYSNKGFTYDASNNDEYKDLLRNAKNIELLDSRKMSLAMKYAYIYFILKQIPVLPTINEDLQIDYSKLEYLYPGKNKFMDFLCQKILDGEDFILPENLVEMVNITDQEQIRKSA
ncbi:MAG: hypothetical protein ABIY50_11855 [Ignavibacteria bacterium]